MKRVRLTIEDERPRVVPLTTFLRDNRDGVTVKERAAIKAGKKVCGGGGAAPAWCVRIVKPRKKR